jgi:hypothetical protein
VGIECGRGAHIRDTRAEPTDVFARLAAEEAPERMASAAPVDVRKEPVGKVEPDPELAEQIQRLLVVDSDELRACLGVPSAVELAERQHAAADAVASLENRDAEAELLKAAGAGEPRQPGADDDHVLPLRAEPEGHGCRGAEELAPGEHYGRRS